MLALKLVCIEISNSDIEGLIYLCIGTLFDIDIILII